MKQWKPTKEALQLLLDGQLAYAEIEGTGVRVDKAYLDATIVSVEKRLVDMEVNLRNHKVARVWKKEYGEKTNFESNDQLAHVIFDCLGFESKDATATGKRQVNKKALEQIEHSFVKEYLSIKPLRQALRTNLIGIRKELVECDGQWFVHPNHNLNTTQTYRPSSDNPNWRNFPKRNPEIAEIVRKCYIPRKGRRFVEIDQGQIEVRVPAALTGDQNLRKYILDKSTDMHRDQSAVVCILTNDQVTKAVRSQVKNQFVFATFYGASPYKSAKGLWDDIDIYKLTTVKGTPLKKWLKKKGIDRLGSMEQKDPIVSGTFVHHVKECQRKLWERFKGYANWRRRTVEKYHREGGLMTATGFVVTGQHSPTEIPNYPIQGPAYHAGCLWPVITLLKAIKKYKMRTLILGDIYDSVQSDVPDKEIQAWLNLSHEVMTQQVPKRFPWLGDIPLETESEVSEVNGTWFGCEQWIPSVEEGNSDSETIWYPKSYVNANLIRG